MHSASQEYVYQAKTDVKQKYTRFNNIYFIQYNTW